MTSKRVLLSAVLTGVILIVMSSGVFGASGDNAFQPIADIFVSLINGVIEILKPILSLALGEYQDSEAYFAKILIALLVFAVAYAVFEKVDIIKAKSWAHWMLAIVVGLLSARFLSEEMLSTAVLPSSVLGVTLTAVIPLVVCFTLFEAIGSKTLRRIAWIFFGVVFLALWAYRASDGSLGQIAYVYPLTAILALLLAIFDGTIRAAWTKVKAENVESEGNSKHYIELSNDFENVKKMVIASKADKTQALKELRRIISQCGLFSGRSFQELMARADHWYTHVDKMSVP